MINEGFVDLRADRHSDGLSESFWPSFTDVMMVIVIIFIMASLVMLVKNWELVAELRATMQAEREAQMVVQNTTNTNNTLSEQLTDTQSQVSLLRMRLMRVREAEQKKNNALHAREKELSSIRQALDSAQARLATQQRNTDRLNSRLIRHTQDYASQTGKLQSVEAEQVVLQQRIKKQSAIILSLKEESHASSLAFSDLQETYLSLNVKYEKLVRPARTARGKLVAEVRYEKLDGVALIRFKKPGENVYVEVNRRDLENQLSQLKKENPGKLYVKIIIPSKSGLSYNDAWKFTSDMLSKYDYYQE
ncbi:MAG: hypothetical protein V3V12_04895 [Gammaproteobacteria bacterium]